MDKKIVVLCLINKEIIAFEFLGVDWDETTDESLHYVEIMNSQKETVGTINETKGCKIIGISFASYPSYHSGLCCVRKQYINDVGGVVIIDE